MTSQAPYSFSEISNSLHKNCPVLAYGYIVGGGGHTWVIDGSLELKRSRNYHVFWIPFPSDEYQGYVHCNFGWSGKDDEGNKDADTIYNYYGSGYYKSGVFSTSAGDYNSKLKIVTNIKPKR